MWIELFERGDEEGCRRSENHKSSFAKHCQKALAPLSRARE
jgi:hypothetical protein